MSRVGVSDHAPLSEQPIIRVFSHSPKPFMCLVLVCKSSSDRMEGTVERRRGIERQRETERWCALTRQRNGEIRRALKWQRRGAQTQPVSQVADHCVHVVRHRCIDLPTNSSAALYGAKKG